MAFTPFSAKNAKIRIGSSTFTAKVWEVTPKTNPADTTNFEGGGFGDAIGTILEADISIQDADFDADANPYDNPPNLRPVQVVEDLKLYLNDTTSPFWQFLRALVLETPNIARVREAMKLSCKLYGKGSFSFPSGSVVVSL